MALCRLWVGELGSGLGPKDPKVGEATTQLSLDRFISKKCLMVEQPKAVSDCYCFSPQAL